MSEFYRFPHTPHLAWLGEGEPRADKVLDRREASALLSHEVVVEEKVDGANLGFSVDEHGVLRAQNRGGYLSLTHLHWQFKPLSRWLLEHERALTDALYPDLMLFGEWCYALHSIAYTRLPDWFIAFDVYDRAQRIFWSTRRRDALLVDLGIASVPRLGEGRFGLDGLVALLGKSCLTDGPAEGLYVRRETSERLVERAKLVRSEFVQAIGEHWSRGPRRTNALARPNEDRDRGELA